MSDKGPDRERDYFPQRRSLHPYIPALGPFSERPNETMAEAIKRIEGGAS